MAGRCMAFYTIEDSEGCPTIDVCVKVGNPGVDGEEDVRRFDAEVFEIGKCVRVLGSAFTDHRKRKRCVNVREAERIALGTFAATTDETSDSLARIKNRDVMFDMMSKGSEVNSSEVTVEASVAAACKFFVNEGCCRFGDRCRFAHPTARHMVQPAWVRTRKHARQALQAAEAVRAGSRSEANGQGFEAGHCGSIVAKSKRAAVFAAWLVDTFGETFLRGLSSI